MTAASDILFTPFQSPKLALPNRIVMAPMTRSFSPSNIPGPDVAAYYRRRAEGGIGLIPNRRHEELMSFSKDALATLS